MNQPDNPAGPGALQGFGQHAAKGLKGIFGQ